MKRLYIILLVALICSLSACTEDLSRICPNGSGSLADGVEITLQFPDMTSVATRSIDDGNDPVLKDLDLYIFVFDGSSLLQTIHVDHTEWDSQTANRIRFTAHLPQTEGNAVIHIVAVDDRGGAFTQQIDDISYGIEDSVMPALYLTNDQDAYWQRIDLETPIIVTVSNESDPTLANIQGTEAKVKSKFEKPIPLVRNFAKITLSKDSGPNASATLSDFEIKGWTIVNDLDAGSVVPWYSPSGVNDIYYPDYSYSYGNAGSDMPDYADLSDLGYQGVSQTGASRRHTLDEGKPGDINENGATWGLGDKYLYERKATVQNPLYILLYGEYKGKGGYYKIALAKRDDQTGLVTEYNVLRNITYNIVIKDVTAPGYDTPADAATGPAFNNVSGDVTTKNMTQISDGVDKLYVSFVNYVITQPNHVIDFKYRFVNDITGSKTPNNDAVRFKTQGIGIALGNVIKAFGTNVVDGDAENSYTDQEAVVITERDGSEWRNVMIKANDPSDELQIQTFTIYTEPANAGTASDGQTGIGLSRTVNLVLRNPWNFIRMEVFPGHWTDDSQWPDYDPDDAPSDPDVNYYVGSAIGAPLTIFWELPAGLPEAMFPLQFQIESDRQNIENAGVGNAVVQSGPSLFSGVADSRISYIKTVNWQDYAPDGESSTESSRIIRARFTTTTNIDSPSIYGDAKVSMVRLHNPYFNDIDDQFERNKNQFVDNREAADPTPIVWDFSSDEWADFISKCANKTFSGSTAAVRGLTITQSNASNNYRFTGSASGEKYFVMHRSDDNIYFLLHYPEGKAVNAVMKVTVDRDQVNNTTVSLVARTPTSVGMTQSSASNNITGREERIYTFAIPTDELDLGITLKPGSNTNANNGVRIYKIEFYPMGEEAAND